MSGFINVESYLAPFPRVFSVSFLFGIVITSRGEERAGRCIFRAFVCMSCMHYMLLFLGVEDRLQIVIMAFPGYLI